MKMKTIYSDGKTLEIERKLKITVYLPQLCHFCGEEIITFESHKSESLVFHSLDGDHDNWDPDNKAPAHHGCHQRYHMTGENHPLYGKGHSNKAKRKMRDAWTEDRKKHQRERFSGDNNPMYGNTEAAKRGWDTRRKNHGPSGYKGEHHMKRPDVAKKVGDANRGNSQIGIKGAQTKRDRYTPEEISEIYERAVITRRERNGSSLRKPKEEMI